MIELIERWALAFGPPILIGALVAYAVRRWLRVHIAWAILAGTLVAVVLGYPIKTHAVRLTMPNPNYTPKNSK
ncbi:MAG TPA: hypothetical protein VKR31_08835 [Rhizomicrobium sp.]|nr:hypothetical protein [Rhizomicrobium sp.]